MAHHTPFDSDGTPEVPNVRDKSLNSGCSGDSGYTDDPEDLLHQGRSMKESEKHGSTSIAHEFELFFEKYYQEIFTYILLIVENWHDAQEMCMDTFLVASKSWPQIKYFEEKAQRRWLYVVGRNKANNYFRWWRHRFRHWTYESGPVEPLGSVPENPSPLPTPKPQLSDLIDSFESERVRDNLAKLSKRERECLVLRSHGFSYSEIAEICKLKESSVRGNITRAKEKYKKVDSAWNASSQDKERSE